jgi:uncharacterized membrane protein
VFGHPYHPGGFFWFPVLSWVLGILLIALIIFLVVRLLRSGGSWSAPTHHHAEAAEEILHRRLANGEIDVDEYERRMAALRAQRPSSG